MSKSCQSVLIKTRTDDLQSSLSTFQVNRWLIKINRSWSIVDRHLQVSIYIDQSWSMLINLDHMRRRFSSVDQHHWSTDQQPIVFMHDMIKIDQHWSRLINVNWHLKVSINHHFNHGFLKISQCKPLCCRSRYNPSNNGYSPRPAYQTSRRSRESISANPGGYRCQDTNLWGQGVYHEWEAGVTGHWPVRRGCVLWMGGGWQDTNQWGQGAYYAWEVGLTGYQPVRIHSSKILTIQQGIPRGISSIGKPCRPQQGFPRWVYPGNSLML